MRTRARAASLMLLIDAMIKQEKFEGCAMDLAGL
jgi:hypothetical protein